jgi:hypothetical protein
MCSCCALHLCRLPEFCNSQTPDHLKTPSAQEAFNPNGLLLHPCSVACIVCAVPHAFAARLLVLADP